MLNACDAQWKNTRNMAIVTAASIILNLLLIPQWQAVGARATVLATNFLMFVLSIMAVRKIIVYRARKNLLMFVKVLFASLLMGAVIWGGQGYFNVFITTILGALIYFFILFLLGGFSRADILSIYQSFRKSDEGVDKINADL
jgi:O-antigen/teichoic acid export membrane protein